jgi:acid phosphatase type 7
VGVAGVLAALAAGGTALAKADPPRVLNGPFLTGVTDTGVEVRFELAAPGPASVEVRPDPPAPGATKRTAPLVLRDSTAVAMHVVPAAGLEPVTRYLYRVTSGALVLEEGHFKTAPRPGSGEPITFLAYGDCRTDAAAHAAVMHAMAQYPADFIVNTGDLVERGNSLENWEQLFDLEAEILRDHPVLAAIGNHELSGDPSGTTFLRYFGMPDPAGGPVRLYGTTRMGDARFFVLNGRSDWQGGDQRRWLEAELAKADAEEGLGWRIVLVHDGPWSVGPHGPNLAMLEARVPELLAAHKVDFILSGHDHLYERGQSSTLKYIVTGGAGAPLYDVVRDLTQNRKAVAAHHFVQVTIRGDTLVSDAWRPDGTALDHCAFRRGGDWDCDAPARAAATSKMDLPAAGRGDAGPSAAPPGDSRVVYWLVGLSVPAGVAAWAARRRVAASAARGAGAAGAARRKV